MGLFINNYYMTSLMALHHTHDGFWYFFRCYKNNTNSWQLWTCQQKVILCQGSCVFSDLILVSNYHSYKGKTIKLLPYHSFYEGHIHQEILSSLVWQSASEKYKTTRIHLYQLPTKKFQTSTVTKFTTFYIKHMWLLLLLNRI